AMRSSSIPQARQSLSVDGPAGDGKSPLDASGVRKERAMKRSKALATAILLCWLYGTAAQGASVVFFDDAQIATPVASGVTWDTISSNGYLFTYTRDKLFTGGIGPDPIGRTVRVPWPERVEAQAVTTPPPGVTDYKARLTLQRVDGDVFDLTAFTAKLLA